MEFLENKRLEITTGTYLLSSAEIKNSFWVIGADAVLIISNYVLGLIWRKGFNYISIRLS